MQPCQEAKESRIKNQELRIKNQKSNGAQTRQTKFLALTLGIKTALETHLIVFERDFVL